MYICGDALALSFRLGFWGTLLERNRKGSKDVPDTQYTKRRLQRQGEVPTVLVVLMRPSYLVFCARGCL
jgi:hypothetical protein